MAIYYPAEFIKEDDGTFFVRFPDIDGCFTSGETLDEAIMMGEDALNLMLWDMEESGEKIPKPSSIEDLKSEEGGFFSMVGADVASYKIKHGNKSIKKSISLPQWLNDLAVANNVNFSETLKNALLLKLDVKLK